MTYRGKILPKNLFISEILPRGRIQAPNMPKYKIIYRGGGYMLPKMISLKFGCAVKKNLAKKQGG